MLSYLDLHGSLLQDEQTAVAGTEVHDFVTAPVKVTVNIEGQPSREYNYEVLNHPTLTAQIAYADVMTKPRAVVELFTSQGCSSCPPADKVVGDLVSEGEVLALTLPVDYWDYLGWRDTLASPDNSARQRAYAAHRGDRSVYTPQIVVNGIEHVVGGNRLSVQEALKRAPRLSAEIDMKHNDMGIEATVTGNLPKDAKMATVFFISLNDREEIPIGRGENAG